MTEGQLVKAIILKMQEVAKRENKPFDAKSLFADLVFKKEKELLKIKNLTDLL